MIFTTLLVAAVASLPAFATPTPTSASAPAVVSPVFCTDATYSPIDPYPYGIPSGSGTCFVPAVKEGKCYNWGDFPHSESGPLRHNLSYTHIGLDFQCNLYKTKHCNGDFFTAQPGDEDYNNTQTVGSGTSFNNEVDSFLCKVYP